MYDSGNWYLRDKPLAPMCQVYAERVYTSSLTICCSVNWDNWVVNNTPLSCSKGFSHEPSLVSTTVLTSVGNTCPGDLIQIQTIVRARVNQFPCVCSREFVGCSRSCSGHQFHGRHVDNSPLVVQTFANTEADTVYMEQNSMKQLLFNPCKWFKVSEYSKTSSSNLLLLLLILWLLRSSDSWSILQ